MAAGHGGLGGGGELGKARRGPVPPRHPPGAGVAAAPAPGWRPRTAGGGARWHGSGWGLGPGVPRDGGGRRREGGSGGRRRRRGRREGGRRCPRGGKGGKRKPAGPPGAKWRRLAGCASRSPGPPSAPRRDHKMEDAAAGRQRKGARARRRDAARRSPESAALGRAAGATRSAAWLGAVAERKSRSRLRREPALKGVGTGKPTRCSARAHAANRSLACRLGSAPPRPDGQSPQSAPPRGRAQARHKLGWPVGCGWGHGVSSN